MTSGLAEDDILPTVVINRQGDIQLAVVFVFLGLIEFIAVHLALTNASDIIRYVHLILSGSFLAYLSCGLISLKFNPIRLGASQIIVPVSMFKAQAIPYEAIKSFDRMGSCNQGKGLKEAFILISEPNFFLTVASDRHRQILGEPLADAGYKMFVDDPQFLIQMLRARIRFED